MTNNTQGLDALAALCGTTVAEENATTTNSATAAMVAPPPNTNGGQNLATASAIYAQQQMQQQAQALQLQQFQQVLAMHQAAAAQQQQQQGGGMMPPQLQQLQNMIAQQQAQQQQQQQHQQQATAAYSQAQAFAAAQLVAAQQQQQQLAAANGTAAAAAVHPGLAALSPAALANFGGQIVPGPATTPMSQLTSNSQALSVSASPALQQVVTNKIHMSSPSTLAMPPPPTKVVPSLPLSNNPRKSTTKSSRRGSGDSSTGGKQSSSPSPSSSKSNKRSSAGAAAQQPPVQDIILEWEDKKQAKRAANRLSAHLSRKRKKMFIDDLKDENVELRRKEQILRSIPDMIVVFDSSGCISFASHSVTRFLDYTSEELVDTSFWERLTVDSVRLIKSAFMDSLAVKRPLDEDSTPLANGESMTVTLIHRAGEVEGTGLLVSLKGVVHFAGESPECVCSIRPEASSASSTTKKMKPVVKESTSSSSGPVKKRVPAVSVAGPPSHQISDIDSASERS